MSIPEKDDHRLHYELLQWGYQENQHMGAPVCSSPSFVEAIRNAGDLADSVQTVFIDSAVCERIGRAVWRLGRVDKAAQTVLRYHYIRQMADEDLPAVPHRKLVKLRAMLWRYVDGD